MGDDNLKDVENKLLKRGAIRSASSLAFSPDSRFLAIGTSDNYIRIWDIQKSVFIREWEAKPGRLDGLLKVVQENSKENELLLNLFVVYHFAAVNSLSFGSGGILLGVGLAEGDVQLWNISGNLIKAWEHKEERPISNLRIHSESIAYVHKNGLIIRRTPSDEDPYGIEVKPPLFEACPLEFSRDGNYLAIATESEWHFVNFKMGTVRKWQFIEPFCENTEGDLFQSLLESKIGSLCWHSSGNRIAIGASNGLIEVWSIDESTQNADPIFSIKLLTIDIGNIFDMRFVENNLITASRKENDIFLWKEAEGCTYKIAYDCKQKKYPSTFSQDGALFAMGLDDGDVYIWQTDGKLLSKMNLRV